MTKDIVGLCVFVFVVYFKFKCFSWFDMLLSFCFYNFVFFYCAFQNDLTIVYSAIFICLILMKFT